jgi:hypothetical protein
MKKNKSRRKNTAPARRAQRNWQKALARTRKAAPPLTRVWAQAWGLLWGRDRQKREGKRRCEMSNELRRLYWLGRALAQQVQHDTPVAKDAYHTRRHVTDVLLTLAHLLRDWQRRALQNTKAMPAWHAQSAACALLAALVHDWGHDGRPNANQSILEIASAERFLAFCISWGQKQTELKVRESHWRETMGLVEVLVLSTHNAHALEAHRSLVSLGLNSPPEISLWLSVLLNEADIATSLLPTYAPALTRALLHEQRAWQVKHGDVVPTAQVERQDVVRAYQAFVRGVRVSSACAIHLGVRDLWWARQIACPDFY